MTIKDIARLSGYSVSTVSRVLNNHPDVNPKTREKVLSVIKEQGFSPNDNAKLLKMQAQSSVAVLVKGSQNPLFADILERSQSLFQQNGEASYVAYLDEDADEVQHAARLMELRHPKGFLFLGGDLEHFKDSFSQLSTPSVLLTNDARALGFPNLSSFTTDDASAAAQVIGSLTEHGHRSIGVIGGSLALHQVSYRRIRGVQQAMEQHGLCFDLDRCYEPCRYSMEEGYQATMRLLKRNGALSAIFALGDVIALGALRAICDRKLRVPEDISLVGYDGIAAAKYSIPRLSTVCQNTEALAARGVSALLQQIRLGAAPLHETIPFELRLSESIGTPRC